MRHARHGRMWWLALVVGVLLLRPAASGAQLSAPFTRIATGDLVTIPAWYFSSAWGDYDDDGYLDLFVGASVAANRNYLYHNNRDGTFTLIDDAHMPKIPSNQHGAAWGDYDNDGHLDLIVTAGQPEVTNNVIYHNNGDGTLSGITNGPIYAQTQPAGFHGPSWADYDNDGLLDLFIAGHGVVNRLFHNDGNGQFTRILPGDPKAGVLVSDVAHSAGRTWVDYDNDGDIDLFVANLFDLPNFLYRNEGSGRFEKVTDSGLTDAVEETDAVCWADYDNDGFVDAFLANIKSASLYHNEQDGTFTRIVDSAMVQEQIPSTAIFSSCAWGDYDDDGFIDLFVTTGCYPASPDCIPRYSLLYHNAGDGTFTKVTGGSVVNDPTTQGAASSWGDYDNDGFLDLLVSQGVFWPDPQTNLLYHNDGNGNGWLNVKLVGTISNRSGIGAKVRIKAFYRGESRWQVREIYGGDGEGNQSNALNAAFGLADATAVDTVRVEWPSGRLQELHDVAPRQFLTITEPGIRPSCEDGVDDDGDGLVDMADPGCPFPSASPENPQCNDGVDNNADGLIDLDDPNCQKPGWPYWEKSPCGLGAELALVLPLLSLAARRRRRASPRGSYPRLINRDAPIVLASKIVAGPAGTNASNTPIS